MRCQTEICYINKYACVRVDWGFCINEARALQSLLSGDFCVRFLPKNGQKSPLFLCFLWKVVKNAKKSKKGVDKKDES